MKKLQRGNLICEVPEAEVKAMQANGWELMKTSRTRKKAEPEPEAEQAPEPEAEQ